MENLDIDLKEVLAKSKDEVIASLVKSTKEEFVNSLSWRLRDAVAKEVDGYIKAEVLPEVKKMLAEKRMEIVEAMHSGIVETAKAVGTKMAEMAKQNVASSYNFKKFMEVLFQ